MAFWLWWDSYGTGDDLALEHTANANSANAFWVDPDDPYSVFVIGQTGTSAGYRQGQITRLFKVHRTPEMTEWVAGIDVKAGEKLTYKGATYEVVQSHRTQAGWEPDRVPSLWKKI